MKAIARHMMVAGAMAAALALAACSSGGKYGGGDSPKDPPSMNGK